MLDRSGMDVDNLISKKIFILPWKKRKYHKIKTKFPSKNIAQVFVSFWKKTGIWNLHALCLLANILRLISPLAPRKQNESRTIIMDREKGGIGGVINMYLPAPGICAILCGFANSYLSVWMIYVAGLGCHNCPLSLWVFYVLTFMDLSIQQIHGSVLLSLQWLSWPNDWLN